eukprot:TRINITY_DN11118_c0_g1_i1.p1 TRINITY_DN11118_c0_g1~~TRINITY_DN11118_c0_g1_i1.p1  ORF type:complete len:1066 (+),score=388.92 TRINITY_DN11118_c0_g1_i1:73-3270(+)
MASAKNLKKRASIAGGSLSASPPGSPRPEGAVQEIFREFQKPGMKNAIQIVSDLQMVITEDQVTTLREDSMVDGELNYAKFEENFNKWADQQEEDREKQKQTAMKRSQSMKQKSGLDPAAAMRLNEPIPKGKETVRVVVRVRPFMPYEIRKAKEQNLTMEPVCFMLDKECQLLNTENGEVQNSFKFDQCFWSIPKEQYPDIEMPFAGQEEVFQYTGIPAVQHAFTGFNTCIFAYGQTGSGKTHSMLGNNDDPGVAPRLIQTLFNRIQEFKDKGEKTKFKVEVCFLEIYNEKVMDLLMNAPVPEEKEIGEGGEGGEKRRKSKAPKADKKKGDNTYRECKVRSSPDKGTYVEGITRLGVYNADETMKSMESGMKYRAVASHSLNATSSRSHAIFQICVRQTFVVGSTRVANINIVDLAGSERMKMTGASGSVADEAKNINQSLSTLRRVIDTLIENSKLRTKKIPPYRESMLTWVLKDSLGGNSKTVMIAAISPHISNYDDTLNTLRYALKAKSIVLNARVNEEQTANMVGALKRELEMLKVQMASGGGGGMDSEEYKAMQEEVARAEVEAQEVKKKAEAELVFKEKQVMEEKKKNFAAVFRTAFFQEKKKQAADDVVAAKDKEIEDLRREVEVAQEEMAASNKRAMERQAQDKVRAQQDTDRIEELEENLQQSERKEAELKKDLDRLTMDMRKGQLQRDKMTDQIDTMKEEMQKLSGSSKEEVEKMQKEINRLLEVEQEADRLRQQLAEQEREYQILLKKCQQLEEDLKRAKKQIEKLLDEKAELRSALAELQDLSQRRQEEVHKIKMEGGREVNILEMEIDQKETLVKNMKEELKQLRGELDKAIDDKRSTEDQMMVMRSKEAKSHRNIVLNANELESQRTKIMELTRENSKVRYELETSQGQISSLTQQLSDGGGGSGSFSVGSPFGARGGDGSPLHTGMAGGASPRRGDGSPSAVYATPAGQTDYDLKGYMSDKFFKAGDKQTIGSRVSPIDGQRVTGERIWTSNGYLYGPAPHRYAGSPVRGGSPGPSRRSNSGTPVSREGASPKFAASPGRGYNSALGSRR